MMKMYSIYAVQNSSYTFQVAEIEKLNLNFLHINHFTLDLNSHMCLKATMVDGAALKSHGSTC